MQGFGSKTGQETTRSIATEKVPFANEDHLKPQYQTSCC